MDIGNRINVLSLGTRDLDYGTNDLEAGPDDLGSWANGVEPVALGPWSDYFGLRTICLEPVTGGITYDLGLATVDLGTWSKVIRQMHDGIKKSVCYCCLILIT